MLDAAVVTSNHRVSRYPSSALDLEMSNPSESNANAAAASALLGVVSRESYSACGRGVIQGRVPGAWQVAATRVMPRETSVTRLVLVILVRSSRVLAVVVVLLTGFVRVAGYPILDRCFEH